MDNLEKLKYPTGRFEAQDTYTYEEIRSFIRTLEKLPRNLKKLIKKLSKQQLNTSYRPGGWTVRQVIHHLADSHMNAYIRMKLAVTETTPVIKPYEEALWAETADSKEMSPKVSLAILKALHERWVYFLNALRLEDLESGYFHPEKQGIIPLPEAIALYAWHAKHHLAHIKMVLDGAKESEDAKQPKTDVESVVDTPKEAPKRRTRIKRAVPVEKVDIEPAPKKAGRPKKAAAETTVAAPKKAGRPKKAAAETTVAAPKKAGRPKKAAAETTVAAPKKAGRPKKAAAETTVAAPKKAGRPKKAAAETTEAAPKKRRVLSPEQIAKMQAARKAGKSGAATKTEDASSGAVKPKSATAKATTTKTTVARKPRTTIVGESAQQPLTPVVKKRRQLSPEQIAKMQAGRQKAKTKK